MDPKDVISDQGDNKSQITNGSKPPESGVFKEKSDAAESVSEPGHPSVIVEGRRKQTTVYEVSDSDEDSIDGLCQAKNDESEINPYETRGNKKAQYIPSYMRQTAASYRRETLILEEKEQKVLEAVKSRMPRRVECVEQQPFNERTPHYMLPTAAYTSLVSVTPAPKPVLSSQIRPVNVDKLPNYMRSTAAYRQSITPNEVKKPVRSTQIRKVDPESLPHYMKTTESFERLIEPDLVPRPIPSNRIKQVGNERPHYMRETEAYRKFVEPTVTPAPRKQIPSNRIKEVDLDNLPHYMRPTQTSRKHMEELDSTRKNKHQQQISLSTSTRSTPSAVSMDEKTTTRDRSGSDTKVGSQPQTPTASFMRNTRSSQAYLKAYEVEKQEREKREAELMRQRNSLAVRRERWDRNVQIVETMAIRHRERIRQEIEEERRVAGDKLPMYAKKSGKEIKKKEDPQK